MTTDHRPSRKVSRVEQQKKLTQACRDANLSFGPRAIAQVVYTFADARIGEAFPSMPLIAHEAGCDVETATKHVRALQRAGILWTILPPRRTSKAAPEPFHTLVALEDGPDGKRPVKTGGEYLVVPPDGRALFLVHPCASQMARVRWETDSRVIRRWSTDAAVAARGGKRLAVSEQPAVVATVDATVAPANEPTTSREVERPSATQPTPATGGSRYDRLRAALAHTDSIDLSGAPAMREQCAAYLDERSLTEKFIGIIADPDNVRAWFRKAVWPKGRPERVTLLMLAGNYDIRNGERIYTWEPLGRVIDAAKEDLAAAKREVEERRRQAELEAESRRKEAEARERRVKFAEESRARLRAKYPDLDLDTSQGFAEAENRELRSATESIIEQGRSRRDAIMAAGSTARSGVPVRLTPADAPKPVLASEPPTRPAGSPRIFSLEEPPVAKAR